MTALSQPDAPEAGLPEDDGGLERDVQAAFQNLKRRWGFDEAMNRLAKIVLKESHWRTIDG